MRRKNYPETIFHSNVSFYLPPKWKQAILDVKKLSIIDNDPKFIKYITQFEGQSMLNWHNTHKMEGKLGMYWRFVMMERLISKYPLLSNYDEKIKEINAKYEELKNQKRIADSEARRIARQQE